MSRKLKGCDEMGHTPFGYRIENGIAVIDEESATKLRRLYENYLSGMSLKTAAANRFHRGDQVPVQTAAGRERLTRPTHYGPHGCVLSAGEHRKSPKYRGIRPAAIQRDGIPLN